MTPRDKRPYAPFDEALQVLVGEKLSSVTFVLDYWQLDFDGNGFNVMSKITIKDHAGEVSSGQPGFRDRLCEQIAKIVRRVRFEDGQGVLITFDDGDFLRLSCRDNDYRGPEAICFRRHGTNWFVV
jgi:hypothetical protein